MNLRVSLRATASVAAIVLLAGCATTSPAATETTPAAVTDTRPLTEVELYDDPRTAEGPVTALMASDVVEPIATNPEQTLPATVTSHDPRGDVEVTVTDTSRVLAIDVSGSLAATVWGLGLGASLVGRDIATTFPGTEDLPIVTASSHSVNAEAVLELRPTLIITDGSVGPRDVITQLRDSGVTVVFVPDESSFAGASNLAVEIGAALGVPELGKQLGAQIADEVAAKIAEITAIAPTDAADRVRVMFLYLRGGSGVYYLFGEDSGASELITSLGAIDIASELGWSGSIPMTDEAMIEANPDLILVMSHGIESTGGIDGLLESKPAIALTLAGQHKRFVDMADGEVLSFGPRSALVLDALARAIYAKA